MNINYFEFAYMSTKKFEGADIAEIYKVIQELKNKKLKFKVILIENCKCMNEYPDFEQD